VFREEGSARSAKKNAYLAGYLALIAGFVNSGGFVLIGSFTSHVTGSLGRMADDVARADGAAAVGASVLVLSFFLGAVAATLILESRSERTGYGIALLVEGLLLLTFVFVAELTQSTHLRVLDAQAVLLCLAMGLQNSLVTRLSGAVVRTTHLTGVVTDIAIETTRWYRWHRAKLPVILELFGTPPVRPHPEKLMVLGTIVLGFTVGAVVGGVLTLRASRWAMLMPAMGIFAASASAFYQRTKVETRR